MLGPLKRNFSSLRPWIQPSTSANISKCKISPCSRLEMEMSAEVLGCIQGLNELKIFFRGPHTIYFDLKKVLGDAFELYITKKWGNTLGFYVHLLTDYKLLFLILQKYSSLYICPLLKLDTSVLSKIKLSFFIPFPAQFLF